MSILRRIEKGDLSYIFSYRNDPKIMPWCRQYAPLHWANHLKWFENQSSDPKIEMFAITPKRQNEVNELAGNFSIDLPIIGVCGLTDIDYINSRAEFSLYICPPYQNQGYAKLALRDLFDFGFKSLNLNMIWGETFEANPAKNLFLNMGMIESGERPQFYFKDGKYITAYLVYILRKKWLNIY